MLISICLATKISNSLVYLTVTTNMARAKVLEGAKDRVFLILEILILIEGVQEEECTDMPEMDTCGILHTPIRIVADKTLTCVGREENATQIEDLKNTIAMRASKRRQAFLSILKQQMSMKILLWRSIPVRTSEQS